MQTVAEFCTSKVDEFFKEFPPKEPSLQSFQPVESALLQMKNDVTIPIIPGKDAVNEPILLFWGLENGDEDAIQETGAYRYIEQFKNSFPRAFYATSGAGKTRRIFEYLSINYGLYFLGQAGGLNWGSIDLQSCYHRGIEKNRSNENYEAVKLNIQVLVYVRCLVFEKITEALGESPTPYQWLLFQAFPNHFLGDDVFQIVSAACLEEARAALRPTVQLESVRRACLNLGVNTLKLQLSLFVDEAQCLLQEYNVDGYFLREADNNVRRTGFSGVLNAFLRSNDIFRSYPLFSGTGLSIEHLDDALKSMMGKLQGVKVPESFYYEFDQLETGQVEEYMENFLDLTDIADHVKTHVFKWLRGRPRWTASFIESYLTRRHRKIQFGTRGRFRSRGKKERHFVQALDRYLSNMTEQAGRKSWPDIDDPDNRGQKRSAISHFMKFMKTGSGLDPSRAAMEHLIFEYATKGMAATVRSDTFRAIEYGLAQVERDAQGKLIGRINEPIIAQAGISLFTLMSMAENFMNTQTDKGTAFERFSVPYLMKNLETIIQAQVEPSKPDNPFQGFRVSEKSSYGVLVQSCKGSVDATLKWIRDSAAARIEGAVPPFCWPDNYFGPDVLSLMFNEQYTDHRTLLAQMKFRNSLNQLEALATLVPAYLYMDNKHIPTPRTKAGEPPKKKKARTLNVNVPKEKWEMTKSFVIPQDKPCLRFMVQYPKAATDTAVPGRRHQDKFEKCSDDDCKSVHDYLIVVAGGSESAGLFFEDGIGTLDSNRASK